MPSETILRAVMIALMLATCVGAEVDQRPLEVAVEPAFPRLVWPSDLTGTDQGLQRDVRPLEITHAGDGSGRLFVATQHGTIHVLPPDPHAAEAPLFLDLRDRVAFDEQTNEEGLLGLTFHPRFAENGQLFVYYTQSRAAQPERRSIVSRFRVSPSDPNRADPGSEEILLRVAQPYGNHNGGTVVFGPDGYLYIVLGDGGSANDPHMHGQNLQTLLGAILRIDVDQQDQGLRYAIPPDNPFVDQRKMARGEIWAYGLRNVWRLSFDRQTGLAWAGDVGQNQWEEINLIRRGGNYGWNFREARHAFGPGGSEPAPRFLEPIWEYPHDLGKSITGGIVYRGSAAPELVGAYLYADYVSGRIWALWYDATTETVTANRMLRDKGPPVITFGEDEQQEAYFATQAGGMFRFATPAVGPP